MSLVPRFIVCTLVIVLWIRFSVLCVTCLMLLTLVPVVVGLCLVSCVVSLFPTVTIDSARLSRLRRLCLTCLCLVSVVSWFILLRDSPSVVRPVVPVCTTRPEVTIRFVTSVASVTRNMVAGVGHLRVRIIVLNVMR